MSTSLPASLLSRLGSVFLSYGIYLAQAAVYYHSCRINQGKLVKVRILAAYLCLIQVVVSIYYTWSLGYIAVAAFNGIPDANQQETSNETTRKFDMPPMANLVIQPMMKNFLFAMLIDIPIQFAMAWRLKSYTNFRVRVIPGAVLLINLCSIVYIGMGIIAARKAIQQDQPNIPPTPSDLKIEELSLSRFAVYTGYILVTVIIDAVMTVPLFMIFAGRTSFKRFGADKRPFIQKMLALAAVTFGALTTVGILIKLDLRGNDHQPGDPHKIYQSLTTFIPREFVLSKLYTLTLLTILSAGLLRIECNVSEFAQSQRPVPEVQTAGNEGYELQKLVNDGGPV